MLVSAFGAAAGAMVVMGQRVVLTTGVMVTVALIPSITIVGVAAVVADFGLAGDGLLRWLLDVGLVLGVAGLVLWLKKVLLHQGRELSGSAAPDGGRLPRPAGGRGRPTL